MSRYLKPSSSNRYLDSAPSVATTGSDTLASNENSAAQFLVSKIATDYTALDQQQFAALSEFSANTREHRKRTENRWASCQFTDRDNAEFEQLLKSLESVSDNRR